MKREETRLMVTRRTLIKGAAVAPIAGMMAAHLPSRIVAAQGATIRVGSKNFPEALIIGEIYSQTLEAAGFTVERLLNLGGTVVAHEALVNGDLDLYPEYTGTGLLVILEKTVADATGGAEATAVAASPVAEGGFGPVDTAVFNYVKAEYEAQFGLTWLDQSPMNNTQALAVKRAFSEENGITTISQLWAYGQENDLTISAPVDFEEREDGLAGLTATYGETNASVNGVDPGIKYQALVDDDANVVLAFSTDAEIGFYDLVVLQDDLGLWPPYHVAPVARMDTLSANAGVADALNAVAPLLTSDTMIALNGLVVGDEKQEPADVARDFLTQNGVVSG
jgi:osmoprotectant transport system substrate-binding protein